MLHWILSPNKKVSIHRKFDKNEAKGNFEAFFQNSDLLVFCSAPLHICFKKFTFLWLKANAIPVARSSFKMSHPSFEDKIKKILCKLWELKELKIDLKIVKITFCVLIEFIKRAYYNLDVLILAHKIGSAKLNVLI